MKNITYSFLSAILTINLLIASFLYVQATESNDGGMFMEGFSYTQIAPFEFNWGDFFI